MDELAAMGSRLATEIDHTSEEVKSNEKALQTAEALREKQVAEYQADEQAGGPKRGLRGLEKDERRRKSIGKRVESWDFDRISPLGTRIC